MLILTKKRLEEYLISFGVPIDRWGKGQSKTIDHLFIEIVKGESVLSLDNNYKEVESLSIVVTYDNLKLIEDYQIFNDGRTRSRKMNASVAEKIDKNDKDLVQAVIRGIKEELSIDVRENQIVEIGSVNVVRNSMSYPGILSKMKLHKFSIDLDLDQYNPNGYVEIQDDKKTYFKWVKK